MMHYYMMCYLFIFYYKMLLIYMLEYMLTVAFVDAVFVMLLLML